MYLKYTCTGTCAGTKGKARRWGVFTFYTNYDLLLGNHYFWKRYDEKDAPCQWRSNSNV